MIVGVSDKMITMKKSILITLTILSLFACAKPPVTRPEMALEPLSWWRSVSAQDDMAFKDIAAAARQSLEYYKKLSPETTFSIGPMMVTALPR